MKDLTQQQTDALKLLGISQDEWWFVSGRYLEARKELENLRVSLGRIAQALEAVSHIPNHSGKADCNFQSLTYAAKNKERGWNALGAEIVDQISRLHERANQLLDAINHP